MMLQHRIMNKQNKAKCKQTTNTTKIKDLEAPKQKKQKKADSDPASLSSYGF